MSERGETLKLEFSPTKDGGFNKRLRETFTEARFRPATKWDGTPVAAIYPMQLHLY